LAHDVFISHSSTDKAIADRVLRALEEAGIRCWIAPRDLLPGRSYPAQIVAGIRASRLMVILVSPGANASSQVLREVERAGHHELPLIPFWLERVGLSDDLEFYLSVLHRLEAFPPPLEPHIGTLVRAVETHLARASQARVAPPLTHAVVDQCVTIPLVPQAPSLYVANIYDRRAFGPSEWILCVRSSMTTGELTRRLPVAVKLCSHKFVMKLVERALPGLTIHHIPSPPPAIVARGAAACFTISKSGPCWAHVENTQALGAYVPEDIPNAELELLVVPSK
jgi:hypothetical protein